MNDNGYKKVTETVRVTNDEKSTTYDLGKFNITQTTGNEHTEGIGEKYVPKNQLPVGRENFNLEEFETSKNVISLERRTYEVYTEDITYGTERQAKKATRASFVLEFINRMSGNHDERIKTSNNIYE